MPRSQSGEHGQVVAYFGEEAIQIAYAATKNGGGYIWKGSTGVCETLDSQTAKTILEQTAQVGTYCCGFTLQVAYKLAQGPRPV